MCLKWCASGDQFRFLFLVHINDVPNCLRYSEWRMYTDDTRITYAMGSSDVTILMIAFIMI